MTSRSTSSPRTASLQSAVTGSEPVPKLMGSGAEGDLYGHESGVTLGAVLGVEFVEPADRRQNGHIADLEIVGHVGTDGSDLALEGAQDCACSEVAAAQASSRPGAQRARHGGDRRPDHIVRDASPGPCPVAAGWQARRARGSPVSTPAAPASTTLNVSYWRCRGTRPWLLTSLSAGVSVASKAMRQTSALITGTDA
jgi:hypothetical protein